MANFIQASEHPDPEHWVSYNVPINLDKVLYVKRSRSSRGHGIHSIAFYTEIGDENKRIEWSYKLEITRDSDYECIINNMRLNKKENES